MLRFLLYLGKANGAISRHVVPGGFRSPLFFCLSLFSLLSRRGGTKKNTRREPVRPRTWVLLCFRERRCVGLLKKKVDIWVKVLRKCSAFTSLPAGGRNETVGCFLFWFFSLERNSRIRCDSRAFSRAARMYMGRHRRSTSVGISFRALSKLFPRMCAPSLPSFFIFVFSFEVICACRTPRRWCTPLC